MLFWITKLMRIYKSVVKEVLKWNLKTVMPKWLLIMNNAYGCSSICIIGQTVFELEKVQQSILIFFTQIFFWLSIDLNWKLENPKDLS